MIVPSEFQGSAALQFIQSRGWEWKQVDSKQVELETCPYCQKSNFGHLYMELHSPADPQANRDGLHLCHRCGKSGNLFSLKQHLGVSTTREQELVPAGGGHSEQEPLPDADVAHDALLADADAMDYLVNGRGFSDQIIRQQKIGFTPDRYFRETGKVRAIIYPYLVNGNCVFAHYRTLPTMPLVGNKVPKAFSSPKGWDAPLYNGGILAHVGLKELVMVEGEANCIAAMDKGIHHICGVPGANFKKADWIDALDKLGLEKIYICYDKDRVGQQAAQALASRIGVENCWKMVLPDFTVTTDEGETRKGKDLNEWFTFGNGTAEQFEQLKQAAQLFDVDGVTSSTDALAELEELILGNGVEPKYKTPWPVLNRLVGFDPGDVIDIVAEEKIGKGGRLTTKVLTPTGWKLMGNLKVGDPLASVDGQSSFVTGVFPRGVMDFYNVTFSDGRSTETTADHLWKVRRTTEWSHTPERVFTTQAVASEYCYAGNRRNNKLYIPLASGDFGNDTPLPLDPWLLGVLIGDGCLTGKEVTFASADQQIVDGVASVVAVLGKEVRQKGSNPNHRYDFRIPNGGNKQLIECLTNLQLWGHRAESKFIPASYLAASKAQRWDLLRGLMDTDGTASNKHGSISYCTVSKQLADDVVYLVRSLGGIAERRPPQKKQFRYKGEMRTGQPAYIIVIRLPEREQAFRLRRKLDRVHPRVNQCRLTFKSIEAAESGEAVCISVSHPSKLYITDDFIVTHNTTFGLNLMEHMVSTYGEDGVIICLEMTRARMARKWLALVEQIADNIPKSVDEAQALTQVFLAAIPRARAKAAARPGTLYFCYPQYETTEDIYKLIRDCIRRYGAKWIMLDNIQRLADTTSVAKGKNRTEHLSQISKVTSKIGKDHGAQMIRIVQPHNIQEGKIATSRSADGSSQIRKDCDCSIALHRNPSDAVRSVNEWDSMPYIEKETAFDDKMLVTPDLSRYSSGGQCTLHYDGARSTITEYNLAAIAKIKAEATVNVGYHNQAAALKPSAVTSIAAVAGDVAI